MRLVHPRLGQSHLPTIVGIKNLFAAIVIILVFWMILKSVTILFIIGWFLGASSQSSASLRTPLNLTLRGHFPLPQI